MGWASSSAGRASHRTAVTSSLTKVSSTCRARSTRGSGSAVLLRGSFLETVGPFDERLFLYYEDIDLSLRGREPRLALRGGAGVDGAPRPLGVDRRRFRPRPLLQRPEPAPRARPAPGHGCGHACRAPLRRGDRFVRRARSASDVRPRGVRAGAWGRRIPCAGLLGLRAEPPGGTRRPASMASDRRTTCAQSRALRPPMGDDARACWATRAMSGAMVAAVSI